MPDIFFSYASQDRERVKPIVEALALQGWSVWWDRKIPLGKTFDQTIEEALDAAYCVVVVWSQNSVVSEWVKNEAYEGLHRNILVPVLIDDVKIPLGFRRIQAAQLINWKTGQGQVEFELLVETIRNILNENKSTTQLEETEHKKNQPDILSEETRVEVIKEDSEPLKKESQTAQAVNLAENRITSNLNPAQQQQKHEKQGNDAIEEQKAELEEHVLANAVSIGKIDSGKIFIIGAVGLLVVPAMLILITSSC